MPSREKIAGWLREASFAFRAVNCKPLQDQFNDRAAQVEAMRCETCEHWLISHKDDNYQFCFIIDKSTINTFYCSYYKAKEDSNNE